MAIFSHKKKGNPEERISRIPYGNFTLAPYYITPKPSWLSKDLNLLLKEILANGKNCVDGQNGNVFDNVIENWADKAKAELSTQRASRAETIKNLASSRYANYQNAVDWIARDKKELDRIEKEICELNKLYNEMNRDNIFG